jgi:hypothetical protein
MTLGVLLLGAVFVGGILWFVAPFGRGGPPEPVEPSWNYVDLRTSPPGATVQLDGRWLSQETPLGVGLSSVDEHELVLSKEGYRSKTLRIVPGEELPSGEIVLDPIRYGTLLVQSTYGLSILSAERSTLAPFSVDPAVKLETGLYRIRLYAPKVFLDHAHTVRIREGKRTSLEAPPLGKVSVRAVPGNCLLTINGIPAEAVPIDSMGIVAGSHEFAFEWLGGEKQELTVEVRPEQHVYVTGQIK